MNYLIAGATGYLGGHLVREMRRQDLDFRAIARNPEKLKADGLDTSQILVAQVTDPDSISGCCEGVDIVISMVGITRQKDGLTYMDVDYKANRNLLDEALRAGVQRFLYVSVLDGDRLRHLKICEAKERFVDDLKASGMDCIIVRPNGFFSDMADFLDMAKRGKVYLFGNGESRINPIHGADLAKVCLDVIDSKEKEIDVGGPEIFTQNQIAELALEAWGKTPVIAHLPDWMRKLTLWAARTFTPVKTYGPLEFILTAMASDNVAPCHGLHRLGDFFHERAQDQG